MDWLIALPIVFAAVTALYAASWLFTGMSRVVGRSKRPTENTAARGGSAGPQVRG
jgi:hypothetical protein